jgi:hypothetical protein
MIRGTLDRLWPVWSAYTHPFDSALWQGGSALCQAVSALGQVWCACTPFGSALWQAVSALWQVSRYAACREASDSRIRSVQSWGCCPRELTFSVDREGLLFVVHGGLLSTGRGGLLSILALSRCSSAELSEVQGSNAILCGVLSCLLWYS